MDMISHQTVGVYFYAKCVLKLSKVSYVALVVLLGSKDHLAVVTTLYNMMRIVGQNDTSHSGRTIVV